MQLKSLVYCSWKYDKYKVLKDTKLFVSRFEKNVHFEVSQFLTL